jgi:hypothetical protein
LESVTPVHGVADVHEKVLPRQLTFVVIGRGLTLQKVSQDHDRIARSVLLDRPFRFLKELDQRPRRFDHPTGAGLLTHLEKNLRRCHRADEDRGRQEQDRGDRRAKHGLDRVERTIRIPSRPAHDGDGLGANRRVHRVG